METIYSCLRDAHDQDLLWIAALVCVTGVYASISLARHASRVEGNSRKAWAAVAIVSSACTAWATHMVGLLAFQPGMQAGFDPLLTLMSLLLTIIGISASMGTAIGSRNRLRRAGAGLLLGLSIALLHYLGQAAYLVTGRVTWNVQLVALSLAWSLPLFAAAMVLSGDKRNSLRHLAGPLILSAIALLHFAGMAALELTFDPRISLPESALPPDVVAPIVAAVCAALVVLAFMGLRFALAARAQAIRDRSRLKQLADLAVEGLAICRDGTIDAVNGSLATLVGCSQQDLKGRTLSSLLPDTPLSKLSEHQEQDGELFTNDGTRVPVRLLRKIVKIGNVDQTVVAIRDQRERLRTEQRMRTLAFTDALTGLANRLQFNQILSANCEKANATEERFALLLLDLDRFKFVNDTFGHAMGDELLKRVARRLSACCGSTTSIARLGGDEFAIIVDEELAQDTAETIIDVLGRPYLIDGSIMDIAASVGIAIGPADGSNPSVLSRSADLALYTAKHAGGSVYRRFEREMRERAQARRQLELDLRRALVREEFEVHYQPQVDPGDGRFQGAEALVRWRHPERGMVPPADFIPLAEEIGLISPLGEWVLRTACEQATGWPSHLTVAVNLSPVQLRDSALAARVMQILQDTGLPGSRLELEITETALLQDEETTYNTLHALRAMGIRISMDDFGTGYSSLSYLRRFPFSKIKIDRSFVRQVPEDQESVAIIQALTSLAAKLNMTVTVEGVETAEQRAFTVSEGCNQIQGYLISRPIESVSIRALFNEPLQSVA
ncbi:putative bifunctional diguanylate cyclase/phosphodiesterase [Rhizobium halophilum]|uniref:putative bifunctional diguanylate cyclase/phosphodiesterase n=1 Tax=Rhizobium halophilum TaxID=2846852 RepID=UPI001EFDC273|nr:EAL domain-containing protein [Rhizobium halophilum]MCF6370391.1 EAL domain-containing protein [Rhizobium halophilum]